MSQQSMRQAARRSALDATAQRGGPELERRLECLAVEELTARGERDGAVRELSGAPETRYGR